MNYFLFLRKNTLTTSNRMGLVLYIKGAKTDGSALSIIFIEVYGILTDTYALLQKIRR